MKHLLIVDAPGPSYFGEFSMSDATLGGFSAVRHVKGVDRVSTADLAVADVVIVCHGNVFGREQISRLENCRGIVVATAGIDNVDVNAAAERCIPVCNIPDYGAEDVADHAVLLMLACARRLTAMLAETRRAGWDWSVARGAMRLQGRTLGIIGLGRIGRAMADRARAFGMHVAFYDPYVSQGHRKDVEKVEGLDMLLSSCDVLSIHCPLTGETAGMIDRNALGRLRPGSILINTARGGIVDQDALLDKLVAGTLCAAGLDVLSHEPEVPANLLDCEHAVLTPHAAFYTDDGLRAMKDMSLSSAVHFAAGRPEMTSLVAGKPFVDKSTAGHTPPRDSDGLDAIAFERRQDIVEEILRYAGFVSRRNLVCNTFGSIAVRAIDARSGRHVVYTKHMGVSLEEMGSDNIVVLDLESDEMLHGSTRPSIGHQMNREIFRQRPDIHAAVHLHPDEVISYFSILHEEGDRYISNDTALVMQGSIQVLAPDINIELDLAPLREIIGRTNCIVMPQHGITTVGETISEAYHRACSMVAETRRLLHARLLANSVGSTVPFVSDEDVKHMFRIGRRAIYGKAALVAPRRTAMEAREDSTTC